MRFKLFALLVLACLVAVGAAQPVPRKGEKLKVTGIATDAGLVTVGWLRMHRPDLLAAAAKSVKAGKSNRFSLDSLFSPKMQARLANVVFQPPVTKPGAKSPTGWGQIAASQTEPLTVEYTPNPLRFPDVWDKQTVTCTLHLVAPDDGPVTAALGAKSPFAIKRITAFDGTVMRAAVRQAQIATRRVGAETLKAPWTIRAKAGQDVDITLSFSPKFDLFSFTAGPKSDKLSVRGGGFGPGLRPWSISVPVSGMFEGIAIGVIPIAIDRDITVITDIVWQPGVPQTFTGQVELINAGGDAAGVLEAEGLPAGITMKPVNVTVPAGKTVTATVTFAIDQLSHFYEYLADGTSVDLNVKFKHAGQTQDVIMGATFYVGQHLWEWQGSVSSVNFQTSFAIFKNGYFMAGTCGYNANLIIGFEVTAVADLNGMEVMNVGCPVSTNSNFETDYKFTRSVFKDKYIEFITSPIRFTVTATATGP